MCLKPGDFNEQLGLLGRAEQEWTRRSVMLVSEVDFTLLFPHQGRLPYRSSGHTQLLRLYLLYTPCMPRHTHVHMQHTQTLGQCSHELSGHAVRAGPPQPHVERDSGWLSQGGSAWLMGHIICTCAFLAGTGPTYPPYRVQFHHGLQLLDGHLRLHAHHDLSCGVRRGAPIAQHIAALKKPDWTETDRQADKEGAETQ